MSYEKPITGDRNLFRFPCTIGRRLEDRKKAFCHSILQEAVKDCLLKAILPSLKSSFVDMAPWS